MKLPTINFKKSIFKCKIMKIDKALIQIIKSLTDFSLKIEDETNQGFYDIIRKSEEFYSGLLNLVYDLRLVALNEFPNRMPYDLIDSNSNIAFEITSNSSLQKIKHIINKLNNNKITFNKFYIFLLRKKPKNYQRVLTNLNPSTNLEIIDTNDLIAQIFSLDKNKIDEINQYIITSLNIKQPQDEIERRLTKFIQLIEKDGVRETQITQFLAIERNQFILKLFFGAMKVFDEILCEWKINTNKPNLKPDFFIQSSNSYSDIIDFKLPFTKNIIVGKDNRKHFSSKMNEYISQVENYRDYFDETIHRNHIFNKYDIKVVKPIIYLIIGRRSDFNNQEWKKLESRHHNLVIKNFDDIIDVVKSSISLFKDSVN